MSSGSRFIAAAVAALGVSAASAGFLAARRIHSRPQAASASVLAEPTPTAVPSPVVTTEVEPAVRDAGSVDPASEGRPARMRPETVVTTMATKTRTPTSPPASAPTPARVAADSPATSAAAPQRAPSPALEPVVESPASLPPAPLPAPAPAPPPPKAPAVEAAPPPPAAVEAAPVEIPEPRFEEYTVKADSVLGIRIDQSLSSATAKLEDRVTASVSRDVIVNGRTVVPRNARLEGDVTLVQPGSKFKGRARLGIRFHTLVMADGLRVPIRTETLYRDGGSATGSTAAKVGGGAAAGAILGAVLGGKKGAIIGAGVGAGAGTAAVMAGDTKDALLESGTPLTVRLTSPVTLTIERDPSSR